MDRCATGLRTAATVRVDPHIGWAIINHSDACISIVKTYHRDQVVREFTRQQCRRAIVDATMQRARWQRGITSPWMVPVWLRGACITKHGVRMRVVSDRG